MAEGGVRDRAGEAMTRAKRRIGLENPSAADDDGNPGIVRGALRALGQGELDQFIDFLHPDVTWEAPGGNFPGGESLDGREEVREHFLGNIGRTFVKFGFVPEKFIDAGDENAVVVLGTFAAEGAAGGETVHEPSVMVFQFEGTEADHVRVYTDSAKFPEVITKEKEKELEEEEKRKEEEEKEKESEGSSDSDDSDSGDSDSDDDSDSADDSSSDSDSERKDPEARSGSDDGADSEGSRRDSESGDGDSDGDRTKERDEEKSRSDG